MTAGQFPDPEQAVADALGALEGVAVAYAGSRTLASIQAGKLPAVRAMRAGGTRDRITDRPVISVAFFAPDAATAKSLAEAADQALTVYGGVSTAHGFIDRAVTEQGPQLVSSSDVALPQCATASYQVSMRRLAQ